MGESENSQLNELTAGEKDGASPNIAGPAIPASPADEALTELEKRVKALEEKPKDTQDKLYALSGIVGGVGVNVIGFYATQVYDQRSRTTEQLDRERGVIATQTADG